MMRQRKPNRLKKYDYSQSGAYFITICTKNREWLFWNLGAEFAHPSEPQPPVGAGFARPTEPQAPVGAGFAHPTEPQAPVGAGFARPNLSRQGKIVENFIHKIPEKYPTASIDHYVLMPNHVHMILTLWKQEGAALQPGRADSALQPGRADSALQPGRADSALQPGRADPAPTVGNIMGWFKYMTTKNIDSPVAIWQRSYHDHIIRNEEDYLRIAQYIQNNPLQWEMDCHNPLSNRYKNWSDA